MEPALTHPGAGRSPTLSALRGPCSDDPSEITSFAAGRLTDPACC